MLIVGWRVPLGRRADWIGAFIVAASGLGAVLLYRYVDVGTARRACSHEPAPLAQHSAARLPTAVLLGDLDADPRCGPVPGRRLTAGLLADRAVLYCRTGRPKQKGAMPGAPMVDGWMDRGLLVCPWHGSRFDPVTGQVVRGPATAPLPCYQTRIRAGTIEVRPGKPTGLRAATGVGQ